MSRYLRFALLFAVAFLLGSQVVGCSCAAEKVTENLVEEATGVEVDQDGDSVTITGEGEDGEQVTITGGEGGSVPEDFPTDFPIYDGKVTGSSSLATGDGSMYTVSVETEDGLDAVKAFFDEELEAEGWTVVFTNEMTQDGVTTVNYALEKAGRNGTITASLEGATTTITHSVFED